MVESGFAELFESYDLVVTPGANTPAFDVDLRHPEAIGGVKHYMAASLVTAAVTLSASPALSLPCGFDQYGRPVGLQLVGRPRGEAALLAAGALYEMETGLASRVPIDPRAGEVPRGMGGGKFLQRSYVPEPLHRSFCHCQSKLA